MRLDDLAKMTGTTFGFDDISPKLERGASRAGNRFTVMAKGIGFEIGGSSAVDADGNRSDLISAARNTATEIVFPGQCPPPENVKDAAAALDFLSSSVSISLVDKARARIAVGSADKIMAQHARQKAALEEHGGPQAELLGHVADAEAFFGLAQRAADLTGMAVDGKVVSLFDQVDHEQIWVGLSNAGVRSSMRALEMTHPETAYEKVGATTPEEFEYAVANLGVAPRVEGGNAHRSHEFFRIAPAVVERMRQSDRRMAFSEIRKQAGAKAHYEKKLREPLQEMGSFLNVSRAEISCGTHDLTDRVIRYELRHADRDRATKLMAFRKVAEEHPDALSEASIENREKALKEGLFFDKRNRTAMINAHSIGKIVAAREEGEVEARRQTILQGASHPDEGMKESYLRISLGSIVNSAADKIDTHGLSREQKSEIAAARRLVSETNLPRAKPEALAQAATTIGAYHANSSDKMRQTLKAVATIAREDMPQISRSQDRSLAAQGEG